MKKLTRSIGDKKIFGVCGGFGEYANIDPVIFRLLFVLGIFAGTLGFWLYLVLALVMPKGEEIIQESTAKKLRRPKQNSKIFGVCEAFANYFGTDVTVVRVIAVVLAFVGMGILAYIISAICIPVEE